jgi:hypothetical protein
VKLPRGRLLLVVRSERELRSTLAAAIYGTASPQSGSRGVATVAMVAAHLVLGLALVSLGAAFVVRRRSLARNEARRRRMVMGPAGWMVLGTILALAGLLQLAVTVT